MFHQISRRLQTLWKIIQLYLSTSVEIGDTRYSRNYFLIHGVISEGSITKDLITYFCVNKDTCIIQHVCVYLTDNFIMTAGLLQNDQIAGKVISCSEIPENIAVNSTTNFNVLEIKCVNRFCEGFDTMQFRTQVRTFSGKVLPPISAFSITSWCPLSQASQSRNISHK